MDCKVTHSFVFQPKADPFFNLHFRPECQSERKKHVFFHFYYQFPQKHTHLLHFVKDMQTPLGKYKESLYLCRQKPNPLKILKI